ncbi:hypothetical protein AAG565_02565 [Fontimonas sp. SYSU GA230001]|uniref:SurA N-terminal domain-containing protein n=1 Tax=Fontimonas sp. SYSU GA230001 TaxID=3142450 RepID=UPI0032B352A6
MDAEAYWTRHRIALAWAAVLLGSLIAAVTLYVDGRDALPADAVAMVGSQPILRSQWLRAVQAVEADRGAPLDAPARRAILQRLIDEELLFQHAIDSGLARNDPALRKTLVAGLVDATTAGAAVDENDARALFEQDPAYFSAQARLRIGAVLAPADTAADDARLAAALRDGDVRAPLRAIELPAQALTLPQIAQRLGGSAAELLRTAERGRVLGPLRGGDARLYLMLHERLADMPRYDQVADAVRTELSRRQAEAALERLLVTLRSSTPVRTADAP